VKAPFRWRFLGLAAVAGIVAFAVIRVRLAPPPELPPVRMHAPPTPMLMYVAPRADLPELVAVRYRIRLDARMERAMSLLDRWSGGTGEIRLDFSKGSWRVLRSGHEIATLSELPDFEE
jgi:hypothetical protein